MGSVVTFIFHCFLYFSRYLTSMEGLYVYGDVFSKDKRLITTHFPLSKTDVNLSAEFDDNIVGHISTWRTTPDKFYGLRAKIGVWSSENIGYSQESGASISAFGKPPENPNVFEVGFHVFPELYNNSDVHFFTYWSRDASSGCYNLRCPGFVSANGAALFPGQAVAPPSTYNGDDRYITISLRTDPNTGDWVVYQDDRYTPSFLGYFPKELCPDLIASATGVAWNGFVSRTVKKA